MGVVAAAAAVVATAVLRPDIAVSSVCPYSRNALTWIFAP